MFIFYSLKQAILKFHGCKLLGPHLILKKILCACMERPAEEVDVIEHFYCTHNKPCFEDLRNIYLANQCFYFLDVFDAKTCLHLTTLNAGGYPGQMFHYYI